MKHAVLLKHTIYSMIIVTGNDVHHKALTGEGRLIDPDNAPDYFLPEQISKPKTEIHAISAEIDEC